ncbi:MAG: DUF433 domain-containing protein [Caldilineaceae bacterium]|nr:DUF433 domain-containing protein [Caldilineaceae bacterium]MBP8293471.1 DUF433 domain-containing protein [Caldilineaceae bacterium]
MKSEISIPIEPIQVAPLFDILAPDDIRIHGHRIGIEHIVFAFNRGETAEEIMQRFPGLDLRTVYSLIAYYLTYRDQIDKYLDHLDQSSAESRAAWAHTRTSLSHRIGAILRERAETEYAP